MRNRLNIISLGFALTGFLALAVLSAGQDAGVSGRTPYARSGHEVTLSGTITLSGKRPKPLIIDTSADPACDQLNPVLETDSVAGTNERLANVFVYVKSEALDAYTFEQPTLPVMLEHRGCRYVPHVLGIRTGQLLIISNSDPTTHNTHPTPKNNAEWNQSQPPDTPPIIKGFKQSELFIPFKDNQHPWEKAYVGVFDHPFFAVTDESGNYKIEGLPPGQYTVVAWHERLGEKTFEITFVPSETREITFNFEAPDERLR